jgi:hypothetical protein
MTPNPSRSSGRCAGFLLRLERSNCAIDFCSYNDRKNGSFNMSSEKKSADEEAWRGRATRVGLGG